jgi:hypothetical protein
MGDTDEHPPESTIRKSFPDPVPQQPIGSDNHTHKSLFESHGKYNAFQQT